MGKKKNTLLIGESSSRITRSTGNFDILADCDDEFPALGSITPVAPDAGAKTGDAAKPGQIVAKLSGQSVPKLGANKTATSPNKMSEPVLIKQAQENASAKLAQNVTASLLEKEQNKNGDAGVVKPWSSLFKDNRDPSNGLKLRYIQPKGTSLDFTDRDLPSMVDMWGFCLVGFFSGKFPGLKVIYDLKNTWGVSCIVNTHSKGWIIFKFQNDEDRSKVLNGGPYTIFGIQLMLKALSEDFSFDDEEFLKVPIWVKFPNLHMKLWNEEAMSEVASMVGVPLSTDKITQNRSNHHFARVLIEVDVSKPPPLSFPIRLPSCKVVKQMVVYETFPNFCFHCKIYGHHPFICKKLVAKEQDESIVEKEKESEEIVVAKTAQHVELRAEMNGETGVMPIVPAATVEDTKEATTHDQTVAQGAVLGVQPAATILHSAPTAQGAGLGVQSDATVLHSAPTAQGHSKLAKGCSKADENDSEVVLEDIERIVMDERNLKLNDVVIKFAVINGKTLKLAVKPFKFVCASVIRVDTSLRLTDDLDRKGITFTAKCLEAMPGVTKKNGEICFDSKFTTPFRAFFGV
ncbi:unnamed protein product [Cuscuta epithymum]|uniref:DUF4283 domain-containing protein n=1 Tax=Cuscuta epithymum TaxID=186058 RepID=A0AAV0FIC7_9ASTE|nr:unnamed protein product [Cuscuta epithymum]